MDDDEELLKNIFDDNDFYHMLLKDLIEKKTSGNSEIVSNLPHHPHKKEKSRKAKQALHKQMKNHVKYDIHTKLINFMAPERLPNQITDSARSELFSSLFGARKS